MPLTQHSKFTTHNSSIDWHCHLLPGIDDGSASLEDSVEMARILKAAGFTTVCCTPHMITGVYEKSAAEIKRRTELLQQQLTAESIELQLLAGAEYYLDEYLHRLLDDPLPLGDTQLLLIEIPDHAETEFVKETCYRVKQNGYTPLIAHPERCCLLELKSGDSVKKSLWGSFFNSQLKTHNSELLAYLREIGCLFQGDLGSFTGIYGNRTRNKSIGFLQNGLYDCFGSDAHTPVRLEEMLRLSSVLLPDRGEIAVSREHTLR